MKILLTGAGGQLGHEVARCLRAADHEVLATTRAELDFLRPASIAPFVERRRPDWIVNCAAYTQVDRAESERETAFTVNRDAPGALAAAAAHCAARLLHVSTDFVFDGTQTRPYRETDPPAPLNVYGNSKLAGERAVLQALPDATVLRTAWVYGTHGHNFVKTMLRLARAGRPLRVVDDQTGTPTWSADIAAVIRQLVEHDLAGLFHYAASGPVTWHGFACAILAEAQRLGFELATREVAAIPGADYPVPARRPAWSVLDTARIRSMLSLEIPHWRTSLVKMLTELRSCADC